MKAYFSQKQGKHIDIDTMHPEHLRNAINKIKRGGHPMYSTNGRTYNAAMESLKEKYEICIVNAFDMVNAQQRTISFLKNQIVLWAKANNESRVEYNELRAVNTRLLAQTNVRDEGAKKDQFNWVGLPQPVSVLEWLRRTALNIVKETGEVSADTLRAKVKLLGMTVSGKQYPAVFRDARFVQKTFKRSDWKGANGRHINTWIARKVA